MFTKFHSKYERRRTPLEYFSFILSRKIFFWKLNDQASMCSVVNAHDHNWVALHTMLNYMRSKLVTHVVYCYIPCIFKNVALQPKNRSTYTLFLGDSITINSKVLFPGGFRPRVPRLSFLPLLKFTLLNTGNGGGNP